MTTLTHITFDPSKVIVDPECKEPKSAEVGSKLPFKYQTNGKPTWITIKGPECTMRFKHELKHAAKQKMMKDKNYKVSDKDYEYMDDDKTIPKVVVMYSFPESDPKWETLWKPFLDKLDAAAEKMEMDTRPYYWKEVSGEESDTPLPNYRGITFVIPEDETATKRIKSAVYPITDPNNEKYGQVTGFLRLSKRKEGNNVTIVNTPITNPKDLIGKQCIGTPTISIMDTYWSDKTHRCRTKTVGAVIRRIETPSGGIDYSDIIHEYSSDLSLLQDEDELDSQTDKFANDDDIQEAEPEPEPPKAAPPKASAKKAPAKAAPPKVNKPKTAPAKKSPTQANVNALMED